MKRVCITAVRVSVLALIGWAFGPTARAEPLPACELGRQLRAALGFGVRELATLAVDQATCAAIAATAESYCLQHRETVEPLLAAYQQARQEAFRQYEFEGDAAGAGQALEAAMAALADCCSDAAEAMASFLSPEQQDLYARTLTQRLLDAPLALLALAEPQRGQLQAAQQARDSVLRHHRQRKSPKAVQNAWAAFEDVVYAVLTPEQQSEYEDNLTFLVQNLAAVLAADEAACP